MPPKPAAKAAARPKVPAHVQRMKEELQRRMAVEAELKRQQEEEERKLREAARLAEEERRLEEAQRQQRKEQRAKFAVSKEERRLFAEQEKLQQMKDAGYLFPGESGAPTPAIPGRKKKKVKDSAAVPSFTAELSGAPEEEEDLQDEWEAEAEKEEQKHRKAQMPSQQETSPAARDSNSNLGELEPVSKLRSPICCVVGHVDTGKTSILDHLRHTNVQGGEAGGITQQIGASFFPSDTIAKATTKLKEKGHDTRLDVPGLLVIDTPGHESFSNLRVRGSALCDIAVLVVDVMHGLENQTKESIRLLRERKCPFVVALNKIDRLFQWEPMPDGDIQSCLSVQRPHVIQEYEARVGEILLQLKEQGFNAELYYRNKDPRRVVSVVPTSAKTGEGMPDLILLLVSLVQTYMEGKVTYRDDVQCAVLEVKPVEGHGTTVDVILVNGVLRSGEDIVLCGINGPIRTTIRALLTPHPLKELRVKGKYILHQEIRAAMGIKIAAPHLEDTIPGTSLAVLRNKDEVATHQLEADVMREVNNILHQSRPREGVAVHSSTLGSLEALLSFLQSKGIPVASIGLGTIHKRHMYHVVNMKLINPRYAVMLAFDVSADDEAATLARENNVQVFFADIIYHLFDTFEKHCTKVEQAINEELRKRAVFPVQLEVVRGIHNKNPILLEVKVMRGILCSHTPIGYVREDGKVVTAGRVTSIERSNLELQEAKPPTECAIKLVNDEQPNFSYDRFKTVRVVHSIVSRDSIDAVKHFREKLNQDSINLLRDLKHTCGVLDAPKASTAAVKPA